MIDENELLAKIEPLKRAAKIPPIVETGRYTMIVPYVELVNVIKEIAYDEKTEKRQQEVHL